MSVVIVDYGSGNLHSAAKAFERAARDSGIAESIEVSSDPRRVGRADRIVLPGVGAFRDCHDGLKAIPDLWDTIDRQVVDAGKPFLGICVGMQLMASRGLEHVSTDGFGWIPGDVQAIRPKDARLKIPHIGWNTLQQSRPHALLEGLKLGPEGLHAYFVHSYHLAAQQPQHVVATTDYSVPVTAIIARDNMAGTQFHPEKSQTLGLALISNFLKWRP